MCSFCALLPSFSFCLRAMYPAPYILRSRSLTLLPLALCLRHLCLLSFSCFSPSSQPHHVLRPISCALAVLRLSIRYTQSGTTLEGRETMQKGALVYFRNVWGRARLIFVHRIRENESPGFPQLSPTPPDYGQAETKSNDPASLCRCALGESSCWSQLRAPWG